MGHIFLTLFPRKLNALNHQFKCAHAEVSEKVRKIDAKDVCNVNILIWHRDSVMAEDFHNRLFNELYFSIDK